MLSRPNFTVVSNAQVTRIQLEATSDRDTDADSVTSSSGGAAADAAQAGARLRATGVEYIDSCGERHVIRARREVLLCAGAYDSPQLLMLSGIGDPAELARVGIPCRHALPGVGRNLRDHLVLFLQYVSKKASASGAEAEVYGNWDTPTGRQVLERVRAQWERGQPPHSGPGAVPAYRAAVFFHSDFDSASSSSSDSSSDDERDSTSSTRRPNFISFPFNTIRVRQPNGELVDAVGHANQVMHLRPHSVGRLTLRSADPFAPPLIQHNYLSDPGSPLLDSYF